jgi:hypothetical protein
LCYNQKTKPLSINPVLTVLTKLLKNQKDPACLGLFGFISGKTGVERAALQPYFLLPCGRIALCYNKKIGIVDNNI